MSIESKHAYRFEFLKSEEWRGTRLVALARAGAACRICGKVDWSNDAHHRHYNDKWSKTKSGNLVVLCRRDHNLVHNVMKMYPQFKSEQIVNLIKTDRERFGVVVKHFSLKPFSFMTEEEFKERAMHRRLFTAILGRVRNLLTEALDKA